MSEGTTSEVIEATGHTLNLFNGYGLIGLVVGFVMLLFGLLFGLLIWRMTSKDKSDSEPFEKAITIIGQQNSHLVESLTESIQSEMSVLNENIKRVNLTVEDLREMVQGNLRKRIHSLENISNDLARRTSQLEVHVINEGKEIKNPGPRNYLSKVRKEDSIWTREQEDAEK